MGCTIHDATDLTPRFDSRLFTDLDERRDRTRFAAPGCRRRIEDVIDILSRPTFAQLHGSSPIETTRIATTSGTTATDVLDHTTAISWIDGRQVGRLVVQPFRAAPSEFGRPWIADATLHGTGVRCLRVSIAIFDHGTDRCGIQIRPGYRRPWSSRRLRRCLRATHGASLRLRELVLAVDFMPPSHPALDDPHSAESGRIDSGRVEIGHR